MKRSLIVGGSIFIIILFTLMMYSSLVVAENSYLSFSPIDFPNRINKSYDDYHNIHQRYNIIKILDPPGQFINRLARLIYGILLLIFMYLPF